VARDVDIRIDDRRRLAVIFLERVDVRPDDFVDGK
jgi:hypothetical protein